MAAGKKPMNDASLSALMDDIKADSKARAAWIEVEAARRAAMLMREARRQRGFSQAEVAARLGVSQARISQVESGKVEDIPPLEFLALYLDACDTTLVLAAGAQEGEVVDIEPSAGRAPRKAVGTRVDLTKARPGKASLGSLMVFGVRDAATESRIKEAMERQYNVKVERFYKVAPKSSGTKPARHVTKQPKAKLRTSGLINRVDES
jgi:transcriptional regulator with XRE-family HTH domain